MNVFRQSTPKQESSLRNSKLFVVCVLMIQTEYFSLKANKKKFYFLWSTNIETNRNLTTNSY